MRVCVVRDGHTHRSMPFVPLLLERGPYLVLPLARAPLVAPPLLVSLAQARRQVDEFVVAGWRWLVILRLRLRPLLPHDGRVVRRR